MMLTLSDSAKRVQKFLLTKGFSFNVKELPTSTRTAQEAADSIGCRISQIAKSLVFKDKDTGLPIIVIASGSNRVDLKKIKKSTGLRLGKADGKYVKENVGFAIGGVPPVGHSQPLKTLLDTDLKKYEKIWAAAGTPFAVFQLKSIDIEPLTNGTWIELSEDKLKDERTSDMENPWDKELKNDRFDPKDLGKTMKAVITVGNGGYDKLQCRIVRMPVLESGEVLLQVLAAGVNNTEINTRIGWYSSSVSTGTEDAAFAEEKQATDKQDGGWNEVTPFPFIQGTDCCGRVVAVAQDGDQTVIGSRVIVRACMRKFDFDAIDNIWMGSDFDGAFAQFVKVSASEVFSVECDWNDAQLATIPCAYGTAENMVHRAKVTNQDNVLVTGASGGVGSAVIQLVKRRGACVTAIASKTKMENVRSIGADHMIDRDKDVVAHLGENAMDVVIDNVAGPAFDGLLKVLKPGGRYASSGAIGGPIVTLDMRTFYLKDLKLIGCTSWDKPVFPNLISYIENGELQPIVAKTFALDKIADAQREFLKKKHVGNFVLIPPPLDD